MRVLSGVQPSGNPHIGNYFGAIRQFVRLQEEHPRRRVRVMNAGVPGYGTADQLAFLRSRGVTLAPDLVIAGENLTEISFQRQAFAQLHLPGWRRPSPILVKTAHPICAYLWMGHSRYIGYLGVEPNNRFLKAAIEAYKKLGVLPSLIARGNVARNTKLIDPGSPGMKKMLEWIKEGIRRGN